MSILTANSKILTANSKVLTRALNPFTLPNIKVFLSARRYPIVADATALGTVPDLSTAGNSATQATGANQPLYKVNQFFSATKPGYTFDGTNDTVAFSDLTLTQNKAGFSLFCQFKKATAGGTGGQMFFCSVNNSSTTARLSISTRAADAFIAIRRTDAGTAFLLTPPCTDTNEHCIYGTVDMTAGLLTVYFDGQLYGTTAITGTGNTPNTASLASSAGSANSLAGSFFPGTIGSLLVADTVYTDTQLQGLYNYVQQYGGL